MKKHLKWPFYRSLRNVAFAGSMLLSAFTSQAQTTVPASIPDQPIINVTPVGNINCDMVECPAQGGVRLSAIVWDDNSAGTTACSLYVDYTGNLTPVTLPFPATPSGTSFYPDVIIGDATRHGEDQQATHVIGVTYLDPVNYVAYYSWYYVSGVGGALTVTYGGTQTMSGAYGIAKYPHLDAFADNVNTVAGLPGLWEFSAVWEEWPGGGSGPVTLATFGPIDNPGTLTSYLIATCTGGNAMPDVAGITDVNTGARTSLIAYMNNGGVDYAEFDIGTTTVTSSYTLNMNPGAPRIEAMNLYDPTAAIVPTKYQVVAKTTPGGGSDIESCNDTYYPAVSGGALLNANAGLFGGATYSAPAVAAGTGIGGPAANIGNTVYSIGFNVDGSNFLYARQLDLYTGTFPTFPPTANDYYAINQTATGVTYSPLALSSSSNSGFDILSVWWDGNRINRKFSGNAFAFKTTGIAKTEGDMPYRLYPNPATNTLNINGIHNDAVYVISDITGRILNNGNLSKTSSAIQVNTLSSGTYMLRITENNHSQIINFIKE
ncbi:MAG: T9SS type A sorting domain-containing protein [Bacteroidetes bacterium]|nr:T9SS type A sorting domain-containing protein [Bacteroidota bacterium]